MTRIGCVLAAALSVLLGACQQETPSNPDFDDSALFLFDDFETEEPARLAFAVREMERQIYLAVDVDAEESRDRAMIPSRLSDEDLASVVEPASPPEQAVPIAVARVSPWPAEQHARIPLLTDQVPVEPNSPDYYARSFMDGTEACWRQRECLVLRTDNDLERRNIALHIPYRQYKDFRWVDLALPDPADVPPGELAVNEGEPRWGIVARSWIEDEFDGISGNTTLLHSYSVELWIPRDGTGFVRDGSETNADDGAWTGDSEGPGLLRLIAFWTQVVPFEESVTVNTARAGIEDIFVTHDGWLESNPE